MDALLKMKNLIIDDGSSEVAAQLPESEKYVQLPLHKFYGCKISYVTKVGQVFIMLNSSDTTLVDRQIGEWSDFYLNSNIEGLEFDMNNDRMKRMVVIVDHRRQKVARCILLGINAESRRALVDFADLPGKIMEVSIDRLYEATYAVNVTKLKTIPCIIDGMNMFMGTEYLLDAIKSCSEDLQSGSLAYSALAWCNDHMIIKLEETFADHLPVKLNEKMFEWIDKACMNTLLTLPHRGDKEVYIASVTHVSRTGEIYIVKRGNGGKKMPIEIMEEYLEVMSIKLFERLGIPSTNSKNLRMDDLYLAEFPDDGVIYRAKVVDATTNTVKVNFVDYGNSSVIGYDKLYLAKTIDSTIARLRPFCIQAYLKWVGEIVEYEKVLEYIIDKPEWRIQLRKETRNNEMVVVLINPETQANLNMLLITEQLATKHKEEESN